MDLNIEDLYVITLGSSASLDRKPGKNWVESTGELPPFVREVAREIEKSSGKGLDYAIPAAISQIKKWAAKGNAKAAKALAQWEALKAKAKAKKVEASRVEATEDYPAYVCLARGSVDYSLDAVREAWNLQERQRRAALRASSRLSPSADVEYEYRYVREVWNRYLIVGGDEAKRGVVRVPYTVGEDGQVEFGDEQPVQIKYVPVSQASDSVAATAVRLPAGVAPSAEALARVVALARE